MTPDQMEQLTQHFGSKNVELAMIFISDARDPQGLRVSIKATYGLVREVLEVVHREALGLIGDPSSVQLGGVFDARST